jgi:hypothetical protein
LVVGQWLFEQAISALARLAIDGKTLQLFSAACA